MSRPTSPSSCKLIIQFLLACNWSTLLTEVPPLPHPSPAHSPAIPCVRASFSVKVGTLIHSAHTSKCSYVQGLGSRSIRRKNANIQKVGDRRPVLHSTQREEWMDKLHSCTSVHKAHTDHLQSFPIRAQKAICEGTSRSYYHKI